MPITKLTLEKKIWPLLILILLIIQTVNPLKIWMMFLVGMTAVFILSYVWARSLRGSLNLTREMAFGWSQVGDRFQERFYLVNEGFVPALWVAVLDHSDLAGYEGSTVVRLDENGTRLWFRRGVCMQRGLYTIGPTSLKTGDPFGIFSVNFEYTSTTNMVVLPPIVSLPTVEVAPGGRIGEGVRVVRSLDQAVTASGVREHKPKDSLRFIHWPTTARRGELYVRTFDSTPASDHWIILDLYKDVQAGEDQQATEEQSIVLAASLASRSIDEGKGVGLASQGENLIWLPPRLEESQQWKIMRALAVAKLGTLPLKDFLERTRKSIKHRSSLVIITPDLRSDWLVPLGLLMQRGIVPTILLLNAPAYGGEKPADEIEKKLIHLGVQYYLIDPELLDEAKSHSLSKNRKRRALTRENHQLPRRMAA